jgi:flagellin-like protein
MNTKKMAKRLKDSGVSPVIATILMVAITVVLAAVLYVMVSGFTHSPGTANSAGLNEAQSSAYNWTVSVSSVSASNIPISNLKIVISGIAGSTTSYTFANSTWDSTTPQGNILVQFSHSGNSATYLSAGDSFTIVGWQSNTANVNLNGATVTLYDGGSTLGSVTL